MHLYHIDDDKVCKGNYIDLHSLLIRGAPWLEKFSILPNTACPHKNKTKMSSIFLGTLCTMFLQQLKDECYIYLGT